MNKLRYARSNFYQTIIKRISESEAFLRHLADIIANLIICNEETPPQNFSLSFILDLIRRQLYGLYISEHVLSLDDVEKVVQVQGLFYQDKIEFLGASPCGHEKNVHSEEYWTSD